MNTLQKQKHSESTQVLEQRAIILTIWVNLLMGCLGVGFAIYTESEAILLDGVFSFVNFLISLISLHVANIVKSPGDTRYPFGYAVFEPVLNLAKGIIITSVSLYALITAVEAIFSGGRPVHADSAVIYASIAASGCFILAMVLPVIAKKTQSPIVAVDAKNWLIDGIISLAVLVAFFTVDFLHDSSYSQWLVYVDPGIVILMVVFSIMIPINIIVENGAEIIGKAPESNQNESAVQQITEALKTYPEFSLSFRSGRLGRLFYMQVYIVTEQTLEIGQQDAIRELCYLSLLEDYPDLAMDVIFTRDSIWKERAIRSV